MPSRIVTYAHRPKRAPRKRKPVALKGSAIVQKRGTADLPRGEQNKPPPPPANDDRKPPPPGARKPAIVTTADRKQTKMRRAERAPAAEWNDPEAEARVTAFLARVIRPP